jgi:hypothetical protein
MLLTFVEKKRIMITISWLDTFGKVGFDSFAHRSKANDVSVKLTNIKDKNRAIHSNCLEMGAKVICMISFLW